MERRRFIKKTGAVCLGGSIGVSLLSGCSNVYYAAHSMEQNKIKIQKTEFSEHDFILIKNDGLPAPIYISKRGKQFTALLLLCTHKSCEVAPYGNELHCPCHGSEFDNNGKVLTGPAEENLKKFKVEAFDKHLLIS